jgi:sugar phosphate isomerase/epimerase
MDFGISTRCFGTTTLTPNLLDRLLRAGFQRVELHAAVPGYDYRNRSTVRGIARWFLDNGLPAPSLHLPYEKDLLASSAAERQLAIDDTKRSLELADLLAVDFVVLHLGVPGQTFNPVLFDRAYSAVAAIQAFSGVRVLLETLSNEIATPERLAEFRIAAQLPQIGICYDTAHGEMAGSIDAIHLNDRGKEDTRVWPFEGTRNWPALVERLALAGFAGPAILEAEDDRLEKAVDARSRLTDLMAEAADSVEEFRLKYKLPFPKSEDEE